MAVEDGRRRVRTSRSMADNPPGPHCLCFWLYPRLAVSSLGLRALASLQVREPFLNALGLLTSVDFSLFSMTLFGIRTQNYKTVTQFGEVGGREW
eukprot:1142137-Pelagomonas_calceolata.AAC.2